MNARNRRLSVSFALALGAGVAYFGLLDAMISVRVALAIPTIPHIEYRPESRTTICIDLPRPFTKAVLQLRRLPPETPPISIGLIWIEMFDERSAREVREFDALEAIRVFNASHIDV